jgi:hypothetical protein
VAEKKERVERGIYDIVISGVYPRRAMKENKQGAMKQGRVLSFLRAKKVKSLISRVKARYDTSLQKDKKAQFANTVAQARSCVKHKPLQRHALELQRLNNHLGDQVGRGRKSRNPEVAIICNVSTIQKEVDGEKKRGLCENGIAMRGPIK